MKTIYKKKIYLGNVELRDYEVEKFKKSGVKVWVGQEFMELKPKDLRNGKIVNTQFSKINAGQTYRLVAFPWKPQGEQKDLFSIHTSIIDRLRQNTELMSKLGR